LNIIFVSGATARARTLTLDWRHWTMGGIGLAILFLAFTLLFNYLTLRYAAAIKHPLLQAIVLADQRQEAQKAQEVIHGHLSAMAVKLGELQAQMLRIDGLGERLAKLAGLKPQELTMAPLDSSSAGRGGPAPTMTRELSVDEFSLAAPCALARITLTNRRRPPSTGPAPLMTPSAGQNCVSYFKRFKMEIELFEAPPAPALPDGYALLPWSESVLHDHADALFHSFHEGIDFPAEVGTPIEAAASGKVVYAEVHPAYGKMLEIDHGNGLVTRYAHCSSLSVKEGDLVVRGQRVGTVGSTGRSTGPHLHFEVRLNGAPQNPARFLQPTG